MRFKWILLSLILTHTLFGVTPNITDMTPIEKTAQLFFISYNLNKPLHYLYEFLDTYPVGGILLKGSPFPDKNTLKSITTAIQSHSKYPVFLAIDQEGGEVTTLSDFHSPTHNATYGTSPSPNQVFKAAQATGQYLNEVGIHINFAPVLDLNTHKNSPITKRRSYHHSPKIVSQLGTAYIDGLQSTHTYATAKHFPGHGYVTGDSHDTHLTSKESLVYSEKASLPPFIDAIDRNVGLIMMSHLIYPSRDPNTPASLSKPIVTSLLKNDLHFTGLIITDDLEMTAAKPNNHLELFKAFQAGNHFLLLTTPLYKLPNLIQTLNKKINSTYAKERNERVQEILVKKQGLKKTD